MPVANGRTAKAPSEAPADKAKTRGQAPKAAPFNRVWAQMAQGAGQLPASISGEPLERAADATAARVMRGPAEQSGGTRVGNKGPHHSTSFPPVHDVLPGTGHPLDASARSFFEPRFARDFSDVRVHTDASAAASARAIDAKAFTYQNHIAFSAGRYDPASAEGRGLLAHELAHVAQGGDGTPRLWRKGEGTVAEGSGGMQINPPEPAPVAESANLLQVIASGMDVAALTLGAAELKVKWAEGKTNVFVGLHPKFAKVYDSKGKALGGKIPMKKVKGLRFNTGVYAQAPDGKLLALTASADMKDIGVYSGSRKVGAKDFTKEQQAAIDEEIKASEAEARPMKKLAFMEFHIEDMLEEPAKLHAQVATVPNAQLYVFVPTYEASGAGGNGQGASKSLYASPIEGRGDGLPANAPPWPVSLEGPKLVPVDSTPTFEGKVDWTANGNNSNVMAQALSVLGESIHYKWELFDITEHAKQQIAKDPAGAKGAAAAPPARTLEQRIEDFKNSKTGAGTDVTGMGGANREFSRDFEDWWKDTKRAQKGARDPNGDTVGERMSSKLANELSLELAPVALLVTAVGAVVKWAADLFAGPRQQQEVPFQKEGIYLIRVITTPGINEDTEGKSVIRPPSVAAKIAEVTTMETAVAEALDEPGAQLAELEAQIRIAVTMGQTSKAEYLRSLLGEAKLRFQGTPLEVVTKKRDEKLDELKKFREQFPNLSDYSRMREVEMLNDQIALYERHDKDRKAGASEGLGAMARANATLISEVTGEQYPLLISVGPMAMDGVKHRWMVSDVTNRDGDAFIGLGASPSEALEAALTKFGGHAAYGRGTIGLRTAGLGLEAGAKPDMRVTSAPTDWAIAQKRIDDLVMTLALLGLMVASAGTAGALIGAGVAAARLIQRWQAGHLYLDEQTVSDALGLLGGLGAAGQLAGGLRVQKFEKAFAITQEGRASGAQITAAMEAMKGAQELAKLVEIANEALNYAGVLWGNLAFIDQMMTISEQERTGAITHAAARRARATSISSAVQNNGLFLAANVIKAKAAAKAKTSAPQEKVPTPQEKAPTPQEKPPTDTPPADTTVPKEKLPGEEAKPDDGATKPAQPEPLPIGERQATPAELRAALPPDLRELFVLDDTVKNDAAQAEYKLDRATGLITEIRLHCSPDATPATVALHAETLRTMQKYQGFGGRVRKAISWIADIIGVNTLKPENKVSFEAALEVQKLPKLMDDKMAAMRKMDPNARSLAEAQLDFLEVQLEQALSKLDYSEGEGVGYVASKALSKADQKKYAEMKAELRTKTKGSDAHRAQRRKMYEFLGGDMAPETWNKVYDNNLERANKANASVLSEHARLGWGDPDDTVEQTITELGANDVRRLDLADRVKKLGIEVKAYESSKVSATIENIEEVKRDAKLARRGWTMTWVFLGCEPTGPLLKLLLESGITVELRTRPATGPSVLLAQHLPTVPSPVKVGP